MLVLRHDAVVPVDLSAGAAGPVVDSGAAVFNSNALRMSVQVPVGAISGQNLRVQTPTGVQVDVCTPVGMVAGAL
jgi:hypothetical protein